MDQMIAALVEALEEEIKLNEGLLEVGKRKRQELVNMEVDSVERSNREEQTVLVALGEVASRRLKICQTIADALGVREDQATVRQLSSRLPSEPRAKIFTLACDLRRRMTEVARVNESNRLLTEQSLSYVKDFFGILSGAKTGEGTYGRKGLGEQPPGRLGFDHVA